MQTWAFGNTELEMKPVKIHRQENQKCFETKVDTDSILSCLSRACQALLPKRFTDVTWGRQRVCGDLGDSGGWLPAT